jgi:hypothetical protein
MRSISAAAVVSIRWMSSKASFRSSVASDAPRSRTFCSWATVVSATLLEIRSRSWIAVARIARAISARNDAVRAARPDGSPAP